jgi:hypothetical protein
MKVLRLLQGNQSHVEEIFNTQLINVGMVKKSGNIGWVEI